MTDKALHYSTGKPGVDQIPPEVLMEWGAVFTYGERKYARDNWKKGTDWHQFYGSALRHLYKFWAGQDYDECDGSEGCTPEADFCKQHSRLHHLAQALWNIGAIRYFQMQGLGNDSRTPVTTAVKIERPTAKWNEAFALGGDGEIVGTVKKGSTDA